jgi:antitoxin (DNA-binding transcriptional repressor) of toxin-antitoxin stability system
MRISKSQFKARALEIFRQVEASGEAVVITDRGVPSLEVRLYNAQEHSPLALLHGSVLRYENPTEPVEVEAWETAR